MFLKISQYSQENNIVGGPAGLQLYLKETPTQLYFYEICKIFKNTFFKEHIRWLLLILIGTELLSYLN